MDLLELGERIENDGGVMLSDPCVPQKFKLPSEPGGKDIEMKTTGCGKQSRAVIPYDVTESVQVGDEEECSWGSDEVEAQKERGAGFVNVCVEDDGVALWPRYLNVS